MYWGGRQVTIAKREDSLFRYTGSEIREEAARQTRVAFWLQFA